MKCILKRFKNLKVTEIILWKTTTKGNKTFRGNVVLVFVGLVKCVITTCVVIVRLVSANEEKRKQKEVKNVKLLSPNFTLDRLINLQEKKNQWWKQSSLWFLWWMCLLIPWISTRLNVILVFLNRASHICPPNNTYKDWKWLTK